MPRSKTPKSKKPIKYDEAISFMESKIHQINENKVNELIWILEHKEIYTAGTSFKENEILDKSVKIIISDLFFILSETKLIDLIKSVCLELSKEKLLINLSNSFKIILFCFVPSDGFKKKSRF